jgi:hypothetical protein
LLFLREPIIAKLSCGCAGKFSRSFMITPSCILILQWPPLGFRLLDCDLSYLITSKGVDLGDHRSPGMANRA